MKQQQLAILNTKHNITLNIIHIELQDALTAANIALSLSSHINNVKMIILKRKWESAHILSIRFK